MCYRKVKIKGKPDIRVCTKLSGCTFCHNREICTIITDVDEIEYIDDQLERYGR